MKRYIEVEIEREISYAHRLLDHPGQCRFLHGHNGLVKVSVFGELDAKTGMLIDFGTLKEIIDELDHRTILQKGDPLLEALQSLGEPCKVLLEPPTAESLAAYFGWKVLARGPVDELTSIPSWVVDVDFTETADNKVFWRSTADEAVAYGMNAEARL